MPTRKPAPKKSTKKNSLPSRRKWLLPAIIVLLIVGIGGFFAVKSYAGSTYIQVCSSSGSDASMKVYDKYHPSTRYDYIESGVCSKTMYNGFNDIRVDVDPFNKGIDSYKLGIIGNGYGPCHTYSSNPSSDPPNASAVRYRNYHSTTCI
jgi:hypothetical protein